MSQRQNTSRKGSHGRIRRLADLSLTEADLIALRRRGTVCREYRRGSVYFKLRFRTDDGCQRVRYLGSDREVAEAVRCDLRDLQRHRECFADLQRRDTEARKLLRQVKENLEEKLEVIGFHFHGFQIRKCNLQEPAGGSHSQAVE